MKDTELHWIAGIFEGEGTFAFSHGKPKGLSIQMTDKDTLDRVRELAGGNICVTKKQEDHYKDCWKWQIYGASAVSLAREIEPILMSRRKARCREFIEQSVTIESIKGDTDIRIARARELRSQGLTHQAISDIMGVERSVVSHYLSKRYKDR